MTIDDHTAFVEFGKALAQLSVAMNEAVAAVDQGFKAEIDRLNEQSLQEGHTLSQWLGDEEI